MSLAIQCDNCGSARPPSEAASWVAVLGYGVAAHGTAEGVAQQLLQWRHFCTAECAGQWLLSGLASIAERAST